ncbi:MAG: nucleoside monophosphate kinase [Verrucomicrobiales bacterium]
MTSVTKHRIKACILMGAPGAGKGTQGAILGRIPRFHHFSMGDAFRALDTRTEIGQEFVRYSSSGQLVPDEVTVRFFMSQVASRIESHLFKPDIDILILDGIPRNRHQAALLEAHLDVVQLFHLSCPNREELVRRLRKRALKEGRLDDATETVIRNRILTYEAETKELLDHYAGSLIAEVNGLQPPVKVLSDLIQIILLNPSWKDMSRQIV